MIDSIPKLKSKNIDTFIKSINDKINNKYNRPEIFYLITKHYFYIHQSDYFVHFLYI